MSRSLRVSLTHISFVKQAVNRKGFARQKDLAEYLQLSLSTINHFLNGKPVDNLNFIEICENLDLDYEKIADFTTTADNHKNVSNFSENQKTFEDCLSQCSNESLREALKLSFSVIKNLLSNHFFDVQNWEKISNQLNFNHEEVGDLGIDNVQANTSLNQSNISNLSKDKKMFEHYIERSSTEDRCYETISQPGSLLRIKASKRMGKSLLIDRILMEATNNNCQSVYLNVLEASEIISSSPNSLNEFLRWFCTMISRQLELTGELNDYWQDDLGSISNCTIYFQECLLPQINSPLVLALDEVDRIFDASFADNFLGMLRGWHDKAKSRPLWQKLRLVVAHSTEAYLPLNINHSPFNVGVPIELPEFNSEQIQQLAQQQGVIWDNLQVQQLISLLGGHPYLVQRAIYYLKNEQCLFQEMLEKSHTEEGIYSSHLRAHWLNLQQYPELLEAIKQVVEAHEPVRLETTLAFKLQSLGLVFFEGNNVKPRCNLYARYFQERFSL